MISHTISRNNHQGQLSLVTSHNYHGGFESRQLVQIINCRCLSPDPPNNGVTGEWNLGLPSENISAHCSVQAD